MLILSFPCTGNTAGWLLLPATEAYQSLEGLQCAPVAGSANQLTGTTSQGSAEKSFKALVCS